VLAVVVGALGVGRERVDRVFVARPADRAHGGDADSFFPVRERVQREPLDRPRRFLESRGGPQERTAPLRGQSIPRRRCDGDGFRVGKTAQGPLRVAREWGSTRDEGDEVLRAAAVPDASERLHRVAPDRRIARTLECRDDLARVAHMDVRPPGLEVRVHPRERAVH